MASNHFFGAACNFLVTSLLGNAGIKTAGAEIETFSDKVGAKGIKRKN